MRKKVLAIHGEYFHGSELQLYMPYHSTSRSVGFSTHLVVAFCFMCLLEAPLLSLKLSSTLHPVRTALARNEGSTYQENNFWLLYCTEVHVETHCQGRIVASARKRDSDWVPCPVCRNCYMHAATRYVYNGIGTLGTPRQQHSQS